AVGVDGLAILREGGAVALAREELILAGRRRLIARAGSRDHLRQDQVAAVREGQLHSRPAEGRRYLSLLTVVGDRAGSAGAARIAIGIGASRRRRGRRRED